jgi:hypothetical protein
MNMIDERRRILDGRRQGVERRKMQAAHFSGKDRRAGDRRMGASRRGPQ